MGTSTVLIKPALAQNLRRSSGGLQGLEKQVICILSIKS